MSSTISKQQVRQAVRFDRWDLDGSLSSVIETLTLIRDDLVSRGYEPQLELEGSDYGIEAQIYYMRDETDEELTLRTRRFMQAELRERQKYERLKAKYGS